MRSIRTLLGLAWLVVAASLTLAAPVGAQQLVDAGHKGDGSGGLAFVLMVIMVLVIWGSLFSMDRVRRRREQTSPE
jgi:Na+/melibiose symporter-like transporter